MLRFGKQLFDQFGFNPLSSFTKREIWQAGLLKQGWKVFQSTLFIYEERNKKGHSTSDRIFPVSIHSLHLRREKSKEVDAFGMISEVSIHSLHLRREKWETALVLLDDPIDVSIHSLHLRREKFIGLWNNIIVPLMFQSTLFIYEERNVAIVEVYSCPMSCFNPLSSFTKREICQRLGL